MARRRLGSETKVIKSGGKSVYRSTASGRFVTRGYSKQSPPTTVVETVIHSGTKTHREPMSSSTRAGFEQLLKDLG